MIRPTGSPLGFASAPPGAALRSPSTTSSPAPAAPEDRAEVSETREGPGLRELLLASASALALMGAAAPVSAAPAAAIVRAAEPADGNSSASTRRDVGETHPFWRGVDRIEETARAAGKNLKEGVDNLRGAVREATPEPVAEGARDAKEGARRIDDLKSEGQLGSYRYSLDVVDADLDLKPRARIKGGGVEAGLKLEGDLNLLQSRLSKVEETPSGWRTEQGLRGGFHARGEVGAFVGVDRDGGHHESTADSRAEIRGEAFKEWKGRIGDRHLVRFEVAGGVAQDLLHSDTAAYARLEQNWDGGDFRLLERDFHMVGEAREEFRQSLSGGDSHYEYRIFGGASHTFDATALGRKLKVEARLGPEIKGSSDGGVQVRPQLKVKVRY